MQCPKYQPLEMYAHLEENPSTYKNAKAQKLFFQKSSHSNLCSASITLGSNSQDQPPASSTDGNKRVRCVINSARLQGSGKNIYLDKWGRIVRADWLASRPPSEFIPKDAEGVTLRTTRWRKGTVERGPASDLLTSQSFIVLTNKLRLITFLSMDMAHRTAG